MQYELKIVQGNLDTIHLKIRYKRGVIKPIGRIVKIILQI